MGCQDSEAMTPAASFPWFLVQAGTWVSSGRGVGVGGKLPSDLGSPLRECASARTEWLPGTQARSKSQKGWLTGSCAGPQSPQPREGALLGPISRPGSRSRETAMPGRSRGLSLLLLLPCAQRANHSPPRKKDTLASVPPGAPQNPLLFSVPHNPGRL